MLILPVFPAAAFDTFGDRTEISLISCAVSSGARGERTSALKIQLKINGFVGCLILIIVLQRVPFLHYLCLS